MDQAEDDAMSVQVLNPVMLHGLWAVAALAIIGALALARSQRRLAHLAESTLLRQLAPGRSPGRAWLRLGCATAALTLIVVALADIRWGVVTVESRRRGLDVVFLLDLSKSMLAEDARPSRLQRAKQIINDVVDRLPGDRVALIGFAGDASLACPLTLNHDAFSMALDELDPRDSGRGGSLLGDAIRAAGDCFTDPTPEGKLIVIVSDGEDHGSEPLDAAAVVRRERGARVFTIGLGDEREGGRIPVRIGNRSSHLTFEGKEVVTKMDGAALAAIAKAGEGAFVPVGTATGDVGPILQKLLVDSERSAVEGMQVRRHIPRYQWFVGGALALLLIESLVGRRRVARRVEARPNLTPRGTEFQGEPAP